MTGDAAMLMMSQSPARRHTQTIVNLDDGTFIFYGDDVQENYVLVQDDGIAEVNIHDNDGILKGEFTTSAKHAGPGNSNGDDSRPDYGGRDLCNPP